LPATPNHSTSDTGLPTFRGVDAMETDALAMYFNGVTVND
jgi:hypothetical protein